MAKPKAHSPLMALILLLMSAGNAVADNKVVVIPMGADAGVRIYYGSVTWDGTLETGNASSVSRTGTGVYKVVLGTPPQGCAVTATPGPQGVGGSWFPDGIIYAVVPAAGNDVVFHVNQNGVTPVDSDFHFTAICPS